MVQSALHRTAANNDVVVLALEGPGARWHHTPQKVGQQPTAHGLHAPKLARALARSNSQLPVGTGALLSHYADTVTRSQVRPGPELPAVAVASRPWQWQSQCQCWLAPVVPAVAVRAQIATRSQVLRMLPTAASCQTVAVQNASLQS